MPLYSYLKISNNNDPTEFCIECTAMKNPRARISCIRTQLFNWEDNQVAGNKAGKYRPVWDFLLKDYSFYAVKKCHFDTLTEARSYREIVRDELLRKYYLDFTVKRTRVEP